MIELPRACIRADEIARQADFCSFGTNDLTQTTLGFSRDDAEGKFLTRYLEDGVLERNPFEVIDEEGVGELMRIAVERGRGVKDDLKMGICGEHGESRGRWRSATASGSTTSRAPPIASRWRGSRPPRPCSPRAACRQQWQGARKGERNGTVRLDFPVRRDDQRQVRQG